MSDVEYLKQSLREHGIKWVKEPLDLEKYEIVYGMGNIIYHEVFDEAGEQLDSYPELKK